MQRVVKPEYQTQIIERDYIDSKGNLVLANVDNRGYFLPRENAKDLTYINGNYRLMFNKNRDLFDLMLYIKNQFLDNQRGLDNSQKRYLLYPSFRKGNNKQNSLKRDEQNNWKVTIMKRLDYLIQACKYDLPLSFWWITICFASIDSTAQPGEIKDYAMRKENNVYLIDRKFN
jgi:hypothetical protein